MDAHDTIVERGACIAVRRVLKGSRSDTDHCVPCIEITADARAVLYMPQRNQQATSAEEEAHRQQQLQLGEAMCRFLEQRVLPMTAERIRGFMNICLDELPDPSFTCSNTECLVFARHRSWPGTRYILVPEFVLLGCLRRASGSCIEHVFADTARNSRVDPHGVLLLASYDLRHDEHEPNNSATLKLAATVAAIRGAALKVLVRSMGRLRRASDLFRLPPFTSLVRHSMVVAVSERDLADGTLVVLTDATRCLATAVWRAGGYAVLCKDTLAYTMFSDAYAWSAVCLVPSTDVLLDHLCSDELKEHVEARAAAIRQYLAMFDRPELYTAFYRALLEAP